MTVLGFLIVLLLFSLGKMYFSSNTAEWKSTKKSHASGRDQASMESDKGLLPRKQEWLSYRK